MVVLVCRDLIFQSKISAIARALDRSLKTVPGIEQAISLMQSAHSGDELEAKQPAATLLLIDLSHVNSQDFALLASNRANINMPIVAFGSHVDTELLNSARAAGCDEVMARSQFVQVVQELIAQHS